MLRKAVVPHIPIMGIEKIQKEEIMHRNKSISGPSPWGIFNPFIKNTAAGAEAGVGTTAANTRSSLPSLNKQIDLKSNNMQNILITKDKSYKNEKEILIINKKRNMSIVRNILSNANAMVDHRGKKSISNGKIVDKAYCSDFYEFNIEENVIENYKKNKEQYNNNSGLNIFATRKSKFRENFNINHNNESPIKDGNKNIMKNNLNFNSTVNSNQLKFSNTATTWNSNKLDSEATMSRKEEYYNKLKEYSTKNFTVSNFHAEGGGDKDESHPKIEIFNHNLIKLRPDAKISENLKSSKMVPHIGNKPQIGNNLKFPAKIKIKIDENLTDSSDSKDDSISNNNIHNSNRESVAISNGPRNTKNSVKKNTNYRMMDVLNKNQSKFKDAKANANAGGNVDGNKDLGSINKKKKESRNVQIKNFNNDESKITESSLNSDVKKIYNPNVCNTMDDYLDNNFNLYLKEDMFKKFVIGKFVSKMK
jgi:hypothetical protein